MARTWKPIAVGVVMALAGASMLVSAQQPAADLILTNGKIITVDDKFSIAQAVAVRSRISGTSTATSGSTTSIGASAWSA